MEVQEVTAHVLGIPVTTSWWKSAFGGSFWRKRTRCNDLGLMAALVPLLQATGVGSAKPRQDMHALAKRHPFTSLWKVWLR
jgi:xanthine dehydrogenase molybdopterin-binding subunit B